VQRVPQRACPEGREVSLASYPPRVVGLHPGVAAHREHGAAGDVVEVGGRDYASAVVVLPEPRSCGDDLGRCRPVLQARARPGGLLEALHRLRADERRTEGDREHDRRERPTPCGS
jgi:hypothetical protein